MAFSPPNAGAVPVRPTEMSAKPIIATGTQNRSFTPPPPLPKVSHSFMSIFEAVEPSSAIWAPQMVGVSRFRLSVTTGAQLTRS